MTIEQRNTLLSFVAKGTVIDGAILSMDGEGLTVERDGNTIAFFPYDCQPMSEADEAYNKEVRYNAGLFMTCRDNLSELIAQVEQLELACAQVLESSFSGYHTADCETLARDEHGKPTFCECGLVQTKIALCTALGRRQA